MSALESPSATLARFVVDARFEALPDAVRRETKRALLNFLGTAVAGSRDAAITRAIAALAPCSGPAQASVIGRAERFDLLHAAFLNAASGNVLDFDDTHHPTVVHPTSPVAPVPLALAEQAPISGAALLTALALGIEVACRAGNAVTLSHYVRGWHITSTCGVIGAAAAAAKLLRLDAEKTDVALSLGANQACGLVESLGSMAKSVSVGNAARNGLCAALLAREGYTAAADTLTGTRGFTRVISDTPDAEALTRALGADWEILHNAIKPYPNGVVLHPVVDACLQLRAEHAVVADAIERVVVIGHPLLRQRADRPVPASAREAAVSAQHSVAVCFLYGEAGVQQYTDRCVQDPAVRALGSRVSVEEDAGIAVEAARVRVDLRTGQTLQADIGHALGSLARPMSDRQVEDKLRRLCALHDRPLAVDRLIETVWRLDEMEDASVLVRLACGGEH